MIESVGDAAFWGQRFFSLLPTVFIKSHRLFWLGLVLVVAAPGRVRAVIAELGQLLVEGFDRGFLLAQQLLDQIVAVSLKRFLFGEEFFNVVVWHFVLLPGSYVHAPLT